MKEGFIINIFFAHAPDTNLLIDEIKAKVIEKLKGNLSGVTIDATDWRSISSQGIKGRQEMQTELIDAKILVSDITVFIIEEQIGSWGLEHELEIAHKNYLEGKAEIFIYIKKTSSLICTPEQEKRKAFIGKLYDKAVCISYKKKDELFLSLFSDLTKQAYQIVNKASLVPAKSEASFTTDAPTADSSTVIVSEKKNTLLGVVDKVSSLIKNKEKINFSDFEKARLFLYSSALLYEESLPSQILPNHELQLLYKFKEEVQAVQAEGVLILRTLLSDIDDIMVGWYWLSGLKNSQFFLKLSFHFLQNDSSDEVRIGALEIINKFWDNQFFTQLEPLTKTASVTVKSHLLKTIKNHPHKLAVKIVDALLNPENIALSDEAMNAKMHILTQIDPGKALAFLMENKDKKELFYKDSLLKRASIQNLKTLLEKRRDDYLGGSILKELLSRDAVSEEEQQTILEGKNSSFRGLVIENRVENGKITSYREIEKLGKDDGYRSYYSTTDKLNLFKIFFKNTSFEDLSAMLHQSILDGYIIYQIIGEKFFNKFKEQIYADIKDNFKARKQGMFEEESKKYKISLKETEKKYGEFDDFITSQYIRAALNSILLNEIDKEAAAYVGRLFIGSSDSDINELCFKLLIKNGEEKDSDLLFNQLVAWKNIYFKQELIVGILELDRRGRYKIAEKIIDSNESKLVVNTLAFCLKTNKKMNESRLFSLLYDIDNEIRIATFTYLYLIKDGQERKNFCKNFLNKYFNVSTTYYYNIVCWFDRVVYSPTKIRRSYELELERKLLEKIETKVDANITTRFLTRYSRTLRY